MPPNRAKYGNCEFTQCKLLDGAIMTHAVITSGMIFSHSSYRTFLKTVLAEKQLKNKAYSLRAMARDLGLKPAHLSALIKGKNGLSLTSAMRAAQALGLDDSATEYLCLLVQYEAAKIPRLKETFLERMRAINKTTEVKDLNVDLFKMMSEWYHIPILEMTVLEGFQLTAENVAKKLGISRIQAEVAIERLIRLELLERGADGRFRKAVDNYVFKSSKPNPALRAFHKQMIMKAHDSIETQSPEERYVGSQTFSINPNDLKEASEIINEFRKKMVDLFDRSEKKTKTYHLGIQLFDLTKGEKNEVK